MHCLPQLSDLVPLKNGLCSFRAQIGKHHPVDPGTRYTVVSRGGSPTDILNEDTHNNTRDRSITQLAKMSFDEKN